MPFLMSKKRGEKMTQETKNEKAVRIAENRLPRLRKMISLLSNLGNSQYELTDEQSNKIIRILKSDIATLENKLLNRKSEVKSFNVKL
jgi:dissimilatory sulfite reductase (desulfoviridin) alpha/beta subunit